MLAMGTLNSKDTRRISFDNNFSISPALVVQDPMDDIEDDVHMGLEKLSPDKCNEIKFKDNNKSNASHEDGELEYWINRTETLKKEHQLINKIVETEYEKTIDTNNKLYETPKITQERIQKLQPVFEWRSRILQCYGENPHQPLVCAGVVKAFSNYVSSCRIED